MNDFLAAEALLKARLQPLLPSDVQVLAAADLEGVNEQAQHTPAVHIIYDGASIIDEKFDGAAQLIEQRWLVVVAVRNVSEQIAGTGARNAAGPLMNTVLLSLLGHKLSPDFQNLKMANPPVASYNAGFAYFPLAFTTRFTLQSPE